MHRTLLCLLLTVLAVAGWGMDSKDLAQRFEQARFNFDRELAETLLPEYQQAAQLAQTERGWLNFATASLLLAELRRGVYEHKQQDKKARRQLGKDIDIVAKAAIKALQAQPESSENYRLQADLMGTMIRSKFKGMKYQSKLEQALKMALQLDENNANAWVSQARRPLFAPAKHGGNPELALEHLNRALAIEPGHVQALLFTGAAWYKLGDIEKAEANWDRAQRINPNTADARYRLIAIELPAEATNKE